MSSQQQSSPPPTIDLPSREEARQAIEARPIPGTDDVMHIAPLGLYMAAVYEAYVNRTLKTNAEAAADPEVVAMVVERKSIGTVGIDFLNSATQQGGHYLAGPRFGGGAVPFIPSGNYALIPVEGKDTDADRE